MHVPTRCRRCCCSRGTHVGLLMSFATAILIIYSTSTWMEQREILLVRSDIFTQPGTSDTESGVFNARKVHIDEVCKSEPGKQRRRILKESKRTRDVYVDDVHNVSFCVIPKAGCSFWRRALIVANRMVPSARSPYDISPTRIHRVKHNLLSPATNNRSLTSIIFVRNPWSRIYSGYVDKVVGLQLDMIDFQLFRNNVMSFFKRPSNPDCTMDRPFTFKELVQFVAHMTKNGHPVDHHFSPMHPTCSPCHYEYDVIGKLETLYADAQLILKTLDLQNIFNSSDDAGEQKEEDDIRYAAETAIINRQNKKGCMTNVIAYNAIWTTLKMHGLIHKDTPKPDVIKHGNDAVSASQMIQVIKSARDKYGADANARKRSKREIMRRDFSSLTLEDIADFYNAFELDFQLFNYTKWPPIFDKYL